ncbi:hypothetical protein ASE01_01745 [Nocardioides sp. Root190]|uniref:hypothetical protein n=1 Tax=Nocardioides sp. Root190 TaxID=1736488 RepID=UPI0006F8D7C5|nr:hypothetical protein [Nocardioides sp. Root190]KRB80240.1 hypothetical protein ASE01_01745 [Nocardioides sp. Root190]
MPIARSSLTGAAAGVVLLAGAVGFGVGLPEIVEDSDASASADLPTLPDKLDDRFVALSAVTPELGGAKTAEEISQMEAFADQATKSEAEATERLRGLYGDVALRSYLDVPATTATDQQTRPAQFAVTVVAGDAGLVIPSGPFQIDQQGTHYELKEIGGHNCSLIWSDPVDPTTGAPTGAEPTGASYQVECRAERDGLTYDLYSSGLTPDEATYYLDLVLDSTAG